MIRKTLTSILDPLIFGNVFIALCAMAQGALTYLLLNIPMNIGVLALLGCATLFLYNFSLILSKPSEYHSSPHRRIRWFFSHYHTVLFLAILSFLTILPLAFRLSWNSIILLAALSLLAISYNSPIFKLGIHRFGLRNLPGAKLFIIAFVWACSCVWVPIMELQSEGIFISGIDTFLLTFKRFLFVMAITLPFDIRDLYQDRQFHLKTIPVLIGRKKSLLLSLFLLILYIILLLLFADALNLTIVGLIVATLITGLLIFNTKLVKSEYYYFLYLDGTLFLQFLIVWMVNNLS